MKKPIHLLLFFMLVGSLLVGQTPDEKSKFSHAEELRKSYNFNDAILLYKEIFAKTVDTNFQKNLIAQIARSENGMQMLEYGARPRVYGSIDVPLKDFYLYYPDIADSTWILVPKSLNRNRRDYPLNNVMLYRNGESTMYFSAQDSNGKWDIWSTQYIDGIKWSAPQPLGNIVNSPGDELFPVISPDGKKLYFSSDGHSGMGGFDLYISNFDEKAKAWGVPQNLGFPYSSPADDYLFINSDSGDYSILASNRDVKAKDSIQIYQLEFESTPVKSPIGSTQDAIEIASLSPKGKSIHFEIEKSDSNTVETNPEANEYAKMVKEARKIQSDIDKIITEISANRELYNTLTNPDDKTLLEKKISSGELLLIEYQSKLHIANKLVQEKEMNFLSKGIIVPREDFFKESVSEEDTSAVKHKMVTKLSLYGRLPQMEVLDPIVLVDYAFKILDKAVIIEESSLPDGLVYSIQLFLLSKKASLESLKGLSPVFETVTPSGKYLYTVGRFFSYDELSNALAKVKFLKFQNVVALAFNNGNSISIKSARLLEGKITQENSYQVKLEKYPDGIPQPILDLIRKSTEKDIAMKVINGKTIYFIGPFRDKPEADQLMTALSVIAEGVSVEAVKTGQK
ncbi:MAG: hypothetical protein WCX48_01000 [Bacteroidales bacterium]